jgi:A/G-specific adenine glycosylase
MSKASVPTSSEPSPKFRAKRSANRGKKRRREDHAHAPADAQRAPLEADAVRRVQEPKRAAGPEHRTKLHRALLAWYEGARRDLPWRRTRDPYAVWLSEVMLQQTRVETVIPYYERFLARWPTVHALADAPLDDVLTMWSGLGYYRRARMLHAAAQQVTGDRAGVFPSSAEGLAGIKGIGRYTAGAVASIAFGVRAALVDGNVARVLARLFAIEDDVRGAAGQARIWALAEELVHDDDPGAWNQALMELGATICVPRDPRCLLCPVRASCRAREAQRENELPNVAAKAKPREELRWALVARRGDHVLLAQRRAELRFGGMWEPPSIARDGLVQGDAAAAVLRFEALLGVRLTEVARGDDVTHVLSHRRMQLQVLVAEITPGRDAHARAWRPRAPDATGSADYDRLELVPWDRLRAGSSDRALSTLARKLLRAGQTGGAGGAGGAQDAGRRPQRRDASDPRTSRIE